MGCGGGDIVGVMQFLGCGRDMVVGDAVGGGAGHAVVLTDIGRMSAMSARG